MYHHFVEILSHLVPDVEQKKKGGGGGVQNIRDWQPSIAIHLDASFSIYCSK